MISTTKMDHSASRAFGKEILVKGLEWLKESNASSRFMRSPLAGEERGSHGNRCLSPSDEYSDCLVFLNKELEDEFASMTPFQINIMSEILAESIFETTQEVMDKIYAQTDVEKD